jgi:two-component system, chemotaxis family, sensor kinase CheA
MEDLDVVKEFIIESSENLSRLDREMVEVEQRPNDLVLLASIFRTIHTIKGTCGFFGFTVLETITHEAENILSQVRNGERPLTPHLVSLILETVDAIKTELTSIEATAQESGETYVDLVRRQIEASKSMPAPSVQVQVIEGVRGFATEEATAAGGDQDEPATAASATAVETRECQDKNVTAPVLDTPSTPAKGNSVAESTIRVDVGHLDKLMNLVGELVLARNQILQFSAKFEDAQLGRTSQRLNLITTELQESVMKTRMQPIGVVWAKLPRVVRDLSASCGKQISLEMQGSETELDKTIIEAIKDPLTHIIRNSCDHGIETPQARVSAGKPATGTLILKAFHEGGNVTIEVADDGNGIDPQKIKRSAIEKGLIAREHAERMRDTELVNLVFLPGFSTAAKVSNISGRGVGMDVVKTNIEKIGGIVDLVSKPGQGTTVRVKIPLTLAIIPGLVITSSGERFVIPQASLVELLRFEGDGIASHINWLYGAPVCRRRGQLLPLVFLNEALELGAPHGNNLTEAVNVIVLQGEDRQFGLVVDTINDTQEIVVKPLGKQLKSVPCYAGATIMGDGKVALILDVSGLAQRNAVSADASAYQASDPASAGNERVEETQALLLFRAGECERLAVPLSLVARLEEVPRHHIEKAAGKSVVQYRGEILSLVPLSEYLGSQSSFDASGADPLQVIVFADSNRRIGIIVDHIIDIVEASVKVTRSSSHPGLLGSAVVSGKMTDFLDLEAVIRSTEEGWFDPGQSLRGSCNILIVDKSSFSRSLVRNTLEIAGYPVLEAANEVEALEKVKAEPVSVVVIGPGTSDDKIRQLSEAIKADSKSKLVRLISLLQNSRSVAPDFFDDSLVFSDRASMVESIEGLAIAIENANSELCPMTV